MVFTDKITLYRSWDQSPLFYALAELYGLRIVQRDISKRSPEVSVYYPSKLENDCHIELVTQEDSGDLPGSKGVCVQAALPENNYDVLLDARPDDDSLEKKKVYIELIDGALQYTLLGDAGGILRGKICSDDSDLEGFSIPNTSKVNMADLQRGVLKVLARRDIIPSLVEFTYEVKSSGSQNMPVIKTKCSVQDFLFNRVLPLYNVENIA